MSQAILLSVLVLVTFSASSQNKIPSLSKGVNIVDLGVVEAKAP